jgi:hypothetical protein
VRGAGWWGLAGGGLWLGLLGWVVVHGDSGPGVCVLFRSAAPALGRSSRRLPTPACLLTASPRLPTHPPPACLPACPQVRLWDLRANACQALLQAPGLPTTAFDEQGLVFAVGAERGVIKMYDARKWSMGPFTSFPVSE